MRMKLWSTVKQRGISSTAESQLCLWALAVTLCPFLSSPNASSLPLSPLHSSSFSPFSA